MLSTLEIFLGYALYKFTFYLLTYLLTQQNFYARNVNGATGRAGSCAEIV